MARPHVVLVASLLAATLSYALAVASQPDALQSSIIRRHSREDPETANFITGVGGSIVKAASSMACKEGDHVMCPDSTTRCAGDQCCPSTGQGNTACPSASDTFNGCQQPKVHNCLTKATITNVNECNGNHDWPLAESNNRNSCSSGGASISDPKMCELAAQHLGYTYNGAYDWSWLNVAAFQKKPGDFPIVPENCFVENSIVHYNAAASRPAAIDASTGQKHYKGVQICQRAKYVDGTAGVNSDAVASCTNRPNGGPGGGHYEPIDGSGTGDYDQCHAATTCMVGVDWCQMAAFKDKGTDSLGDRPKGCFREAEDAVASNGISVNGCFGYNAMTPTEPVVGRTVCRLKQDYLTAQAARVAAGGA